MGIDLAGLKSAIRADARALGFQQIGVTGIELGEAEAAWRAWLAAGFHGEMDYMARHDPLRARPAELLPGTVRVISARIDYLPQPLADLWAQLERPGAAYISRYALGRDYHKLLRLRLRDLAERIAARAGPHGYRVFADSAPILEKPLAAQAGLGWIGKHTNLIDRRAGSFFFLGEILTDLPLPVDSPVQNHCGSCSRCLRICPTGAIVAPYRLDARRCISYLTIELKGPIPEAFRPAIGNRIFGCDDCQLVCPWNRYARLTDEADFRPRHGLANASLLELFGWEADEFRRKTEGSAIRRIGFERWLRNLAVALGNADPDPAIRAALVARRERVSPLVREHIDWALRRQEQTPVD